MMELVKTKLEQERQQHNVDEEPYVHDSICYNVPDILFQIEFKIQNLIRKRLFEILFTHRQRSAATSITAQTFIMDRNELNMDLSD